MVCELPVLVYHKVDSRRELGITSLSPRRFERQIGFLKHEGYASVSPQSLIACTLGMTHASPLRTPQMHCFDAGLRDSVPVQYAADLFVETQGGHTADTVLSAKPVLITFDDGYEGIYNYAYPILKKYAFKAIVFVTTGYIGKHNKWDTSLGPRFRHLNWSHIREMADDGIWFGSHGVNHTFLTRQSDSAARYEIEASKMELENGLGRPVRFFSYPYGNYDERIISFVREAGYEAAFSLKPEFLRVGYTNSSAPVYALPRIAIYLVDNTWAFKAKIGYIRNGLLPYMQKWKNRLINRCSYASILVERSGP